MSGRLLIVALGLAALVACGGSGAPTAQQAPAEDPYQAPQPAAPADNGDPGSKAKPKKPAQPVANPAPDFTVTTFSNKTFKLSQNLGVPVVLNFWESW